MKIIFDIENIDELKNNHVLLELDTFYFSSIKENKTAYCVIEPTSITELSSLASFSNLHEELMKNFKIKNWKFCEDALEHLVGQWNGEIDTFYSHLSQRIKDFKDADLAEDWSPVIVKS